ncbi:MAG TPA: Pr6Pr family membrane protein [Candidatus Saccharimonadales bacterium]|nr:Pr6Pr family membrane protein [Candidatus Saccharimonadales bacterium]
MKNPTLVSWIRLFLAFLVAAAIAIQLSHTIQIGGNAANFFSFFTIESNILAAILFFVLSISGLVSPGKRSGRFFEFIRGGITLYMTMTGIIYIILLSGNEQALQTTIPWVNAVLHYVMPVAVLIDWLMHPPAQKIAYKKALLWLLYPVTYLCYSLVRGSIVEWYPYPFINPTMSGWSYVVMMCFIITIGVIVLIKILTLTPRRR